MTGKDIMEALSFADDKFIQEAQEGTLKKKSPIRYLVPLAACLCLVFFGLYMRPAPPASPAEGALQEPGMAMDAEVQTEYSENDVPLEEITVLSVSISSYTAAQDDAGAESQP